jgi:hypothetical protein
MKHVVDPSSVQVYSRFPILMYISEFLRRALIGLVAPLQDEVVDGSIHSDSVYNLQFTFKHPFRLKLLQGELSRAACTDSSTDRLAIRSSGPSSRPRPYPAHI